MAFTSAAAHHAPKKCGAHKRVSRVKYFCRRVILCYTFTKGLFLCKSPSCQGNVGVNRVVLVLDELKM
jgi:hypothetical protein